MLRWLAVFPVLMATLLFGVAPARCLAGQAVWRIGVLANNGMERCLREWTPTAEYLESRLPGTRFAIVPLGFDNVRKSVEAAEVDYLVVNPQLYVTLEYAGKVSALATRSVTEGERRTSLYGGVILVRANQDAPRSLKDLKGKRFAAVDPDSLGGFLAAAGVLDKAGVDVETDFSRLFFVGTHDAAVRAVLEEKADAATVRTGVLEEMIAKGDVKPGELKVFPPPQDGRLGELPFLRSTPLYPEWPFARVAHVSWESARPVQAALLDMPEDSEAARSAGLAGWELDSPYSPVLELLTQLRLPPFDSLTHVSLAEAARQHPETVLAILTTVLSLALLAFVLHRVNVRLHQYREKLEKALAGSEAAKADLERSQQEMRQIFEGSAGGMRVIGVDYTVLKVNSAFLALSGFSREELQNRSCFDVFTGKPCRSELCTLRQILSGRERLEMEVEKTRKDGTTVICLLTATPFRSHDGQLMGIIEDFRDITAKKKADTALSVSELEHRSIFQNAPMGIAYFDRSGELLKCNAWFQKVMGLAGASGEGDDCSGRLPDILAPALERALEGTRSDFEGEVPLANGMTAVLRVHLNPVGAEGALPETVIATVEDVTMSRLKEVELRNLWKAVEHCHASILITDASGLILYVNPYFTENTGYSQSEVLGKNPNILKSGKHSQGFYKTMWDTLLEKRAWRGELANRKKNGELYWEDATISPVMDDTGTVTNYIAVKEDVTERKRHEVELKQALGEFEVIFNNTAIPVVLLKGERLISRVNRRFAELFSYSERDLIGQSMNMLHHDPRIAEEFVRSYYKELRAGHVVKMEHRFRRRDGKVLWCLVSGKAFDPGNLEAGVLWAFDDITARKELEKIREDVERIMRHDLKAPLNGIINLPDIILDEGGLNDSQKEMLDYIAQAGRGMLRQVNESLDLYKMETGSYVYQPSRVNLLATVNKVLRDLEGLIKMKSVSVIVTLGGGVPGPADVLIVLGQDQLCYSMAANIVKNAVEASDFGQTVRVDLSEAGKEAVLAVSNSKPVPPSVAPYFFEKYSTSGKSGGTGLGTYSAKLMAAVQGGSIDMFTSEDAGTTVTMRLPLAERA
ncbi:hypothetical protein JCM15519_04890 [Fundidesulfovibrio butyratiphilus]